VALRGAGQQRRLFVQSGSWAWAYDRGDDGTARSDDGTGKSCVRARAWCGSSFSLLTVFFRLRLDFLRARGVSVSLEAFFRWPEISSLCMMRVGRDEDDVPGRRQTPVDN
jgi:hypothetical protein